MSGWVEVTTAGLVPPEPQATCLEVSLSREDALASARQVADGEAFARELQMSLSQEDGVLDIDGAVQIKEDEAFARELAGGEDEDEGRDISLPSASATSCLSQISGTGIMRRVRHLHGPATLPGHLPLVMSPPTLLSGLR